MADEINVVISVTAIKGDFQYQNLKSSYLSDMTTAGGGNPGTVSVTTSQVAVSTTGLTKAGICIIQNLDDTNFIEFGPTGAPIGKLLPGEIATFRIADGATVYLIADTATCLALVQVLDT